jgi:hypothetical protein
MRGIYTGSAMISMDYIVRIYRFKKDRPQSMVGVVEEVGMDGKKSFTTLEELWKILNSSKYRNVPTKSSGKRPKDI